MSAWQGWISFPHSNMQSPECHQLFIKQGTERNLTSGSHSQRIQTDFLPFSMMASHLCLAGTDRFSSQQPTHTVTKLLRVLVTERNLTSGSHSQRIQTDFLPFSMMVSHLCLAGTDRFSSQQPTHTVTKLLRVLVVEKQGTERNLTSGSHSQRIQTDFLPFSMMVSHLCLAGIDRFSAQQPTHTVTKLLRVLVVDKARN